MQRFFLYILLVLFPAGFQSPEVSDASPKELFPPSVQLYQEMQLGDIINFDAFEQALLGYEQINSPKEILTLIDFSKPSTEERLYVLDMKQKKMLYSSHVSHGQNSGANYATSFSNDIGSHKSSLGFFMTEGTYTGRNGYSLVLEGLEKDINDKAKERAIVIHGASYSNPSFISSMGRLGRSHGCPALPSSLTQPIINTIKGGSLLFIYANNPDYTKNSPILRAG